MSKIHVLDATAKQYRVVLHADVPSGNNSALKPYKDCLVQWGRNMTILTVGTGPGQITQQEADEIANGDVVEFVVSLPIESGGGTQASLNAMADAQIAALRDELQEQLKYFGHEQGT